MVKYYLLICFFVFGLIAKAQQKTIIEGNIKSLYNEHASLALYKYINITEPTLSAQNLVDSNFKFQFTLTEPAYFTLSTNKYLLKLFLIEPGDSIHIDINISNIEEITFSGEGSDKANYQYWANVRYQDWYRRPANITSDTGRHYFNFLDSCRLLQLYSLKNFKQLLTPSAYMILYADVFYSFETLKSKYIYNLLRDSTAVEQAKLLYNLYLPVQKKFAFNDTLAYSRYTIDYLIRQNYSDYQYLHIKEKQENGAEKYRLIQNHTKGKIQERILTQLLMGKDALVTETDILECAEDFLKGPYNPSFKALIREKYQLK